MHLDIDLSPQVSARLAETARSRGIGPAELLERLVEQHLTAASPSAASLVFPSAGRAAGRLRARLEAEATDDPDAIREDREALDEMKHSMNAERIRSGAEPLCPCQVL